MRQVALPNARTGCSEENQKPGGGTGGIEKSPSSGNAMSESGPIEAVEETIGALGAPVLLRTVGPSLSPAATVARWRHGGAVIDIAPSDTVRLALSLIDGKHARDPSQGGSLADRVLGGSVSVFSPQERIRVSVEGQADVLQIFLPSRFVKAAIGERFAGLPLVDLHDDRLQANLMQVLVGAARQDSDDHLLVEEGLHGLASRVRALASPRPGMQVGGEALARGGLSATTNRRVQQMIDAALDDSGQPSPTLAELADGANLSVSHFIRAFRQQTGTTPHQYLLRRRMERAISLLGAPATSVADVADSIGFSTPAHFVAAFRAALGVTPGAVRDALAA